MKPISGELQRYIQKYYKIPYENVKQHTKFSHMQKKFINDLHQDIMQGHLEWFQNIKSIVDTKMIRDAKQSVHYSYIPEDFRLIIENLLSPQKTYDFSIYSRRFSVVFYADTDKSFMETKWLKCLQKMYIWLYIASKYASSKCSRNLVIYMYLTPAKKMLPTDNVEIGRTHANTAFTTACTTTTEIHIYREEEWFKVFIHETFHSLGLDFANMPTGLEHKINQLYGLSNSVNDIRLYESYTEVWAELIHTCMIVHYQLIQYKGAENVKTLGYFAEKVRDYLCYEITFSMIQCSKVLRHYGLCYRDLCEASPHSGVASKYREATPVFSYYVLKSLLLFFANDFIEWTMIHNRGSFDFTKTPGNVNAYITFIDTHRTNATYCRIMAMIDTLYRNCRSVQSTGSNTMRMTLFED